MAKPTVYNISGMIKGVNGWGTPFCNNTFTSTLAANTDTSLSVPLDSGMGNINSQNNPKYLAVFTYAPSAKVWVALNTAAAAPAGAPLASSPSVLNPSCKIVQATDVIHMLCVAGADVCVEFFYISEA